MDQLFAPLQTQQRISGGLRDKLEQLKLPVFEALLDTPEFLNDEDHPAREILNDLMRLCLAERASTKNLETTVSGIVKTSSTPRTWIPNSSSFLTASSKPWLSGRTSPS